MKLDLHTIDTLEDALAIAAQLDHFAAEALAEFSDGDLPGGMTRRFLERSFDAPETLVLVAEEAGTGTRRGFCLTGPLADPLTREVLPLVLILHVDPTVRHRGVARALVGEALRLLSRRGIRRLAARAGHNDDALISMGERWGFVRLWELMLHE